ncbi:hypothetical protein D9M69_600700 [compost metagenome]
MRPPATAADSIGWRIASRSAVMPSPYSEAPSSTILKPLCAGGLWLPVTAIPEPVSIRRVAKYTMGVVAMPISMTCMPAERRPACSAAASSTLLRRPSRPTTIDRAPSSRARVPAAMPRLCANRASISSGTVPRMS